MARILIIDDDPTVSDVIARYLELAGHEPVKADNGKEGIRQYVHCRADIVITDIFMPVIDGLETIQQLRILDPLVKIVAISGGSQRLMGMDYLTAAQRFGANASLEKPFRKEALYQTIDALLSQPTLPA